MNSERLKHELVNGKNYKLQRDGENAKIEKFFFDGIIRFLFIRTLDKNVEKGFKDLEQENDVSLEDLKQLKDGLENYNSDELFLYLMSCAHDDWICRNTKKLNSSNLENADKFVPFELLTWDDVRKYYSILSPILDSIGIKFDEDEIKFKFKGNQLAFLINNGIYTNEFLKYKIKDPSDLYVTLAERRRWSKNC